MNLAFKTICGESATVSREMVNKWHNETLPHLLERYDPSDAYIVDETGPFYQCLHNKTFTFHGQSASRAVKKSKKHLTLLLGANMDGSDKIKPMVIGIAVQPRCFRGVQSLPVPYKSNAKAWMTSPIWTEWLQQFDRKMKVARRHVLLIIDNCPAHPKVSNLLNVEVVYLPPNTTSHTQPCDQGIIQAFKQRYRFHLLRKFIDCINSQQDFKLHVLDALTTVKKAWDEVSVTTSANCFTHCGFGGDMETTTTTDFTADEHVVTHKLQEVLDCATPMDEVIEEYIHIDDCVEGAAMLDCSEIASMIKDRTRSAAEEEEESNEKCDAEII